MYENVPHTLDSLDVADIVNTFSHISHYICIASNMFILLLLVYLCDAKQLSVGTCNLDIKLSVNHIIHLLI